jgi:hypothetical protein
MRHPARGGGFRWRIVSEAGVSDGSRGVFSMAKRRRRSRVKRKRPSLILIVALLVLAAGFITRRVLAPRAMHFLTHRSATLPPKTAIAGDRDPVRPSNDDGTSERLTDSDRRALDQLVRQRSGR